jgi:hypothetical protein
MYDKLPTVNYITPQGYRQMSDITVRFKVEQTVIDEQAYPLNVTINDTDRPEVLADRVYKDSNMHWVVLSLNDMINPYYDWVLSSNSLDNYVAEKYPGYTLFLTDVTGTKAFEGSFRTNDIVYATGVTNPASQPAIQSSLMNARVVAYDPQFCRLVMDFTQKTAWIPVEGDYIAGANTNSLGETNYYVAKIGKILESPYAVHHFENSDEEVLDPRVPASSHGDFLSASSFGFTFGATPLGRYIFEDYTDQVITNRDYEIEQNDNKRNIVLVDPRYLKDVNRDVENFLRNA